MKANNLDDAMQTTRRTIVFHDALFASRISTEANNMSILF